MIADSGQQAPAMCQRVQRGVGEQARAEGASASKPNLTTRNENAFLSNDLTVRCSRLEP